MRKRIGASEGASYYLIAICGASILSTIFAYIMNGRVGNFAGMSVASWTSYALTQFAFIGVVLIMGSIRKTDVLAVAHIKPSKNWKQYLLLFPIAFCTILTFYPLSLLFLKFLSVIGYPVQSIITVDFSSVWVYLLALLVMAIIPAVGEELLCRGMLFSGLSTRNVVFGIFMSAFLFSFMHGNPLQTVHQFGLGVVLSVVFILSGSLVPCIIIHFLNNFMTLTVTAYIPQVDQITYNLGNWNYLTGTASVLVGLFLLTILLYCYYRVGKKKVEFHLVENSEDFGDYKLTVSIDNSKVKSNLIKDCFVFIGSLFTKRGWRKVYDTLTNSNDVVYLGKSQPMINVWLAIGFACFYWLLAFLMGIL